MATRVFGAESVAFWRRGTVRLLVCLLALFLAGCGGASANVRALRMYRREDVTPELLNEHLRQLQETLALIDELVNRTPYQPGDPWVAVLPLDDTRAAAATQAIERAGTVEGKPSLLSVYQTHARELIARAQRTAAEAPPAAPSAAPAPPPAPPPPPPASSDPDDLADPGGADPTPSPATAPPPPPPAAPAPAPRGSILDALAQLDPELAALRQEYASAVGDARALGQAVAELQAAKDSRRPNHEDIRRREESVQGMKDALAQKGRGLEQRGERVIARTAESERVVKDAITVTSVTLRLSLEAASLATVVVAEAVTLAAQSPRSWVKNAPGMAELVRDAPVRVRAIAAELDADATALKGLVGALARLDHVNPDDTAGYSYRDGLVDEIVGFTWESVHAEVNAGGEAFFYNALASAEQSSGGGASYDYTGRSYKLVYHVDPIVLASARLSASLDFTKFADAAGLKLGYATNRVYKSGGNIEQGSLARELGITSAWSDALDAALFVAGVKASVRIAQFTSGTVDLVQVADNTNIATFPFAFQLKQIDLGYDFATQIDSPLHSLTLTLGYFDYTLPRVLYEFEDATPDADSRSYVYSRESPPQAVRSRFGMLGVAADAEHPLVGHLIGVIGAKFAIGGGPMKYYFLKDTTLPDEPANRDTTSRFTTGLNAGASLGVRWRLASASTRFSAHFDATYQAQFIVSELGSSNDDSKTINSGSSDLFHGPTLSLGGAF